MDIVDSFYSNGKNILNTTKGFTIIFNLRTNVKAPKQNCILFNGSQHTVTKKLEWNFFIWVLSLAYFCMKHPQKDYIWIAGICTMRMLPIKWRVIEFLVNFRQAEVYHICEFLIRVHEKKWLIESMVPLSKTFFLLFSVYSIAHRNFISGMGKSARYPFDTQKTICMTPKLGKTDIKRLRAVWKWRIVKTTTLNPSIGTPTHFEENSCWKVCAFFNTYSHDIEQVPNKLMQCTVIKLIFAFVGFFLHTSKCKKEFILGLGVLKGLRITWVQLEPWFQCHLTSYLLWRHCLNTA